MRLGSTFEASPNFAKVAPVISKSYGIVCSAPVRSIAGSRRLIGTAQSSTSITSSYGDSSAESIASTASLGPGVHNGEAVAAPAVGACEQNGRIKPCKLLPAGGDRLTGPSMGRPCLSGSSAPTGAGEAWKRDLTPSRSPLPVRTAARDLSGISRADLLISMSPSPDEAPEPPAQGKMNACAASLPSASGDQGATASQISFIHTWQVSTS
jgi:hypothetical protein